jgi:DNA-directed RNA polymerase specialized sigma24 family protein
MPPKKKVDLPDHVREALLGDVHMTYENALDAKALQERADERFKIRIYLATEQGMTTREIAEELGIAQTSVSKYANQGREAYERREQARSQPAGEDPVRSSQREPVG